MKTSMKWLCCAALLLPPATVAGQDAAALRAHAAEWERIVAAEDARAMTPAQLQTLTRTLSSPEPVMRGVAVRAIGRLERADLLDFITPLLRDPDARVRAAAADAAAQAVYRGSGAGAHAALLRALLAEHDPVAAGAMAESLGRLRVTEATQARASADAIVPRLDDAAAARPGALRGLYFMARQPPARAALGSAVADAVRRIAATQQEGEHGERIRTPALMTLPLLGGADEATVLRALDDPSMYVRREAMAAAAALTDTAALHRVLQRGLGDSTPVRYEGVRIYARRLAPTHGCTPIHAAARSADTHVALLAIDLLPTTCAAFPGSSALADSIARNGGSGTAWQRGAHALVALASLDAAPARTLLPRYAGSDNFFVRTYAARAAAAAADTTTLLRLSRDAHANVRTAAVQGLAARVGHAGDSIYTRALESDDSELVLAALAALDGSTATAIAPALHRALARITALKRETSRDARLALIERIARVSQPADAAALRPYLRDFDPAVAAAAADAIGALTGSRPQAEPRPLEPLRVPRFTEAAALERAHVRMILDSGDTVHLRLLPFTAPTNAFRFARLARDHYFDGLTLHRVVYNFVVQGGSPGANEYAGDGPFTRDELGAPNRRGTVGLSTRGRDTGDAQFYFNTVDNVRLDHEYTVFAEVVRGMDAVMKLQEGTRIVRVLID